MTSKESKVADITNPQAVRFANEYARTRADALARAYYEMKSALDEWDATGMDTLIPNNAADTIIDGSATDGRTPITGQNVHQLMETYGRAFVADLEANANLKLNILLQVSVNPGE